MLKLIIGVKGTGKTKTLIAGVNGALEQSKGSVVCIEKGSKLIYDIKYQARLIDTEQYCVSDAQSLYGFIAGIVASDHDLTDLFVDSALKICNDDMQAFEKFIKETDELSEKHNFRCVMTSSIPVEDATETVKQYV